MPVDLSVFERQKSIVDQQQLQDAFELKKALAVAQIKKSQELDLDKVGEVAFAKAAQGIPLSPLEQAGAKYLNNKSGGVYLDTAGNQVQKPKLFEGISGFGQPSVQSSPQVNSGGFKVGSNFANAMGVPSQGGGDFLAEVAPTQAAAPQKNEWDLAYEEQMRANEGNPKAQQAITEAYSKAKLTMSDAEQKNASAADRMAQSLPSLEKPENISAYSNIGQRALDFVNPFGDQFNSPEYKSYNQARKNVSEARLRAVSGAVIGPTEYVNENATLYPQVGDPPELLAQKAANRAVIQRGLARGAGPAYKAPVVTATETPKYKEGAIADGPNGEIQIFLNGSWQPYKGKKK